MRSCDFRHIQVCGASHTESALNAHTECVHMRDESSRARCVAHWHELCSTLSNESHCKIAEKRVIRGYVSHAHSRHAQRCAVRLTPRVAATFLHSNFSAGQCCAWTHRTDTAPGDAPRWRNDQWNLCPDGSVFGLMAVSCLRKLRRRIDRASLVTSIIPVARDYGSEHVLSFTNDVTGTDQMYRCAHS